MALVGAVGLLSLGAYAVYAAVLRGGRAHLPAPVLTAKPQRRTGWTSARFAFAELRPHARFQCSLDGARFVRCASPTRLRALAAGAHTFRVRATLDAGPGHGHRISRATSYSWRIEQRPPTPSIGDRPTDPTTARSAKFTFADGAPGARFQCSLDESRWTRCQSPASYRKLRIGEHWFRVRALRRPARPSFAAQLYWRVMKGERAGKDFSIAAVPTPGELLYPGAPPRPIPVILTNPDDVPIFVTGVTVAIPASPPGCDSASNISLVQSNVSGTAPITVRPHGSVTLSAQGRSAPTIQLLDLPVNQDACQNTKFPLSFTGSAHS